MNEYNRNKRNQKYGFWSMVVGVWLLIFAGDGSTPMSMIFFGVGITIVAITGIVVVKSTKKLKRLQALKEKDEDS
jgi:hypothetical protein